MQVICDIWMTNHNSLLCLIALFSKFVRVGVKFGPPER